MAEFGQNDSSDGQAEAPSEPEKRIAPESALVGDDLYLFGGLSEDESTTLPRSEIWVRNVRVSASKRRWLRRSAGGRSIPPPCVGARCVVLDELIYSYGGMRDDDDDYLGVVYRLDPKTMEWMEVATPIGGKKPPPPRTFCCLCVIGSRMIMFGGVSKEIPDDELQCGATQDNDGFNNDIYEFVLEAGKEEGVWLDLELSGSRPKPLCDPAMTTIDERRAFLLGNDAEKEMHSIVLNLQIKSWINIKFDVKLSPRMGHAMCRLAIEGLEDKPFCLLIGGKDNDREKLSASESTYILNIDDELVYQMDVFEQFQEVFGHTCHCVRNEEKTTEVLVYFNGLRRLHLDSLNESYMKIERRLHWPVIQRELEQLRRKCTQLEEEAESAKAANAEEKRRCEEQAAQTRRDFEQKRADDKRRFEEDKSDTRRRISSHEIDTLRQQLRDAQSNLDAKNIEISSIREEAAEAQRRQNDEIASIKQQLASAQSAASDVQSQLEEKASEYQRNVKQREDEISVLRQDYGSSQDKVASLQQEMFTMKQELSQLRDGLAQEKQDLALCKEKAGETQRRLKEREDDVSKLSKELADAQSRVKNRDEQVSSLTGQLTEAQRNLQYQRDESSSLRSSQVEAAVSMEHRDNEILTLKKELEDSRRGVENKNEENLSLREELEAAQRRLKEREKSSEISTQTEASTSGFRSNLNLQSSNILLCSGIAVAILAAAVYVGYSKAW